MILPKYTASKQAQFNPVVNYVEEVDRVGFEPPTTSAILSLEIFRIQRYLSTTTTTVVCYAFTPPLS